MSKERLEDIDAKWNQHGVMTFEDGDWLIEQAERVQELETRNNNLTFELAVSRTQNKRYRELLEELKQDVGNTRYSEFRKSEFRKMLFYKISEELERESE